MKGHGFSQISDIFFYYIEVSSEFASVSDLKLNEDCRKFSNVQFS